MFFLFIGITDDGFEMLEQLAYLYLANNKVSHGRWSSQLTRTSQVQTVNEHLGLSFHYTWLFSTKQFSTGTGNETE